MNATMKHPFGPCPFGVTRRIFRVERAWVQVAARYDYARGTIVACTIEPDSGKGAMWWDAIDAVEWVTPKSWKFTKAASKTLGISVDDFEAAYFKGTP